jgi:indole-3-glycerol phosphate synthase
MDILDRFIGCARVSLAEGYYAGTGARAEGGAASLRKRFGSGFVLICEIKHASPSGEYAYREIDVAETAAAFSACGADAISCVVEPKVFRGDIMNVGLARRAGLPVLFKDFVFTKEQIDAAHRSGADCVLLVARVARRTGADIDSLIAHAHSLGLETLLECYDADELRDALDTDADILGINNRDLATLGVDIGRTERILREAGGADRPVISESGVRSGADIAYLKRAGASGALVGTAIWKAADMRAKIAELRAGASA